MRPSLRTWCDEDRYQRIFFYGIKKGKEKHQSIKYMVSDLPSLKPPFPQNKCIVRVLQNEASTNMI
jgi:hypothetical protein